MAVGRERGRCSNPLGSLRALFINPAASTLFLAAPNGLRFPVSCLFLKINSFPLSPIVKNIYKLMRWVNDIPITHIFIVKLVLLAWP